MRFRFILAVPVFAILIALTSCKLDSSDPAVGTWTLTAVSIGGGPSLPASLAGAEMTIAVKENHTYTMSGDMGSGPMTDSGTWASSGGSSYTFASESGGGGGTGEISGGTLTLSTIQGGSAIVMKFSQD